jgi:hypothetical protein
LRGGWKYLLTVFQGGREIPSICSWPKGGGEERSSVASCPTSSKNSSIPAGVSGEAVLPLKRVLGVAGAGAHNVLRLTSPVMRTSIGPKGSCALIPFSFSDAHFGESAFCEVHSEPLRRTAPFPILPTTLSPLGVLVSVRHGGAFYVLGLLL